MGLGGLRGDNKLDNNGNVFFHIFEKSQVVLQVHHVQKKEQNLNVIVIMIVFGINIFIIAQL